MKDWSKNWKSSIKPKKQRKYRATAPMHIKAKFMSVHLSKELRQKYSKRSIQVKTNDKVKILRGSSSGKSGAVIKTDVKDTKVYIQGIELTKIDGSKRQLGIHPSNLVITELDLKDKKRIAKLSSKSTSKSPAPKQKPEVKK